MSKEEVFEAMDYFERRIGRRLRVDDVEKKRHPMLPHASVFQRLFGTVGNALVEHYGEVNPQPNKDEDTATAIIQVEIEGLSIAEAARQRGITGQALGRRIRRYKKLYEQE